MSQTIVVQPIPLVQTATSDRPAKNGVAALKVPGTGDWIDTGIAVAPGDHLEANATGTVALADGRKSQPEGIAKGWKDLLRTFPSENANTAALIGRIGNSDAAVPFAIGGSLSQDMPAAGELFVAVNAGSQLAGAGAYRATIRLTKVTVAVAHTPPVDIRQLLTPALLGSVPQRVVDQQGDPGDLINFALLGTEAQVEKAFTAAGWVQVDKTTDQAVIHGFIATLSKKAYLEMPMSMLYLYGRPQDLSYARADPLMVSLVRHHLRLWNTGQIVAGRPLWVGSATHDNGLERDQRDNGITHHIDPAIDVERDFIQQSFTAAGSVAAAAYAVPSNAIHQARTATGGEFTTDGRILFIVLAGSSPGV